ncbi:RelA/SpoT domain-containing protein [Pontibacter sp. HSC-14F20]|uniref:RelA/SpoT domain-containing protein n=1 Tax=Pontibacter sp. HSC-14F20 TaxID=2864136 RepID=UPI001C73D502|nr:RelA/SpoT domain-containing protein [Pontibacter sp. HSC-14F20]MBX0335072.1 RelA/SpoT domain-containing protein [Pontibacter sp. HSC-14F20]
MSIHSVTLSYILTALKTSQEDLCAQGINPHTLVAIYNDFLTRKYDLNAISQITANTLLQAPGAQAIRYRIKDPLHLLRKVIRKKAEYPERVIDHHSYLDWINDLVGIRVLYLYKESWRSLGQYIEEVWPLKRPPVAYIHECDTGMLVEELEKGGCTLRRHPLGYRAVHYVISTQPHRQRYFVEIQLRTLFEEGWSEIDHTVRYPDRTCNGFARDLLAVLNRLTGNADDIATFIKIFFDKMQAKKSGHSTATWTQEERQELEDEIKKLPVTPEERQRLHEHIRQLPGRIHSAD